MHNFRESKKCQKKGGSPVKCAFLPVKCAFWIFKFSSQVFHPTMRNARKSMFSKILNRFKKPLKRGIVDNIVIYYS